MWQLIQKEWNDLKNITLTEVVGLLILLAFVWAITAAASTFTNYKLKPYRTDYERTHDRFEANSKGCFRVGMVLLIFAFVFALYWWWWRQPIKA